MAKKKALGRGLEHLFEQEEELATPTANDQEVVEINLTEIVANPYQPRKNFDDEKLKELADSIKENGVFQPILVRSSIIGYELIAGERRLRASEVAGKETIPAIIRSYDDEEMMEISLIENIQRENLTIVEEAKSLQMMLEHLKITQKELAEKIGKSRTHVTNILRLLQLDENILAKIDNNEITMGHAKVLITIEDKTKQNAIVEQIIQEGLNVRETEKIVQNVKENNSLKKNETKQGKPKKKSEMQTSDNYNRLEKIMREKLGTQVQIKGTNSGSINIAFTSDDDLERLLELMKIV